MYFVDSDDYIADDAIEYLYKLCKQYNVQFSTCLSQAIDNYKFKVKKSNEKVTIIDSCEMLKRILLAKDSAVTTWNKLIQKDVYNGIKFNNKYINDQEATHRLVIKTEKIAYSNQIKYFYFKNSEGITAYAQKNTQRSKNMYKVVVERYEDIKKYYPKLLENDVCLLRRIIKLYLTNDEELQKYLKEQKADEYIKKLFSYKMLFKRINIKIKILFILYRISPKFCKYINKNYQKIRYTYYK